MTDTMKKNNNSSPPLMLSPAVCGFPSPAEQYVDTPLDLNELLIAEKMLSAP